MNSDIQNLLTWEKPIIKDTRLSVGFSLELLVFGVTENEILQDCPQLTAV